MVYCLQAALAFTSAARRDAVLNGIATRIAGRPRWGVDELQAVSLAPRIPGGTDGLRTTLRFVSRADEEDLMARIEALATGQRTPIDGSWVALHDCGHDDEEGACAPAERREWQGGVLA